jgi:hypothetical protein
MLLPSPKDADASIPTSASLDPNIHLLSSQHIIIKPRPFLHHTPICWVLLLIYCLLYPSSSPTTALSLIHSHSCPSNNTVGGTLITHLHSAPIRYYVCPFSLTSSVWFKLLA